MIRETRDVLFHTGTIYDQKRRAASMKYNKPPNQRGRLYPYASPKRGGRETYQEFSRRMHRYH